MRRFVALPAIVSLLFFAAATGVSAAPQRDTWDISYPMSDCGYAVDVHDYGSDTYFRVSADGWTLAKNWEGTRDYTNPANRATARMVWTWMTSQSVASRTDTTISLVISSHGSMRVVASPTGRVVAFDSGQETVTRNMELSGEEWVQVGPDELIDVRGPHPMDFGNAFCDAISTLLNP